MEIRIPLALCLVIFIVNIQETKTIECYVCGGIGALEPFKYSNAKEKSIPVIASSCDEFDRNEEKSAILPKYIVKCPDDYHGCITQIDESGTVTRTCDLLPINDCKTANGVQYCYCNTPLCNLKQGHFPTQRNVNNILTNDNTDDEDIIDGNDEDQEEASGSYGNEHNNNDDEDYDSRLGSTEIINRTNNLTSYRRKTSILPSINNDKSLIAINNDNNNSSSNSNSNNCNRQRYSINFSQKISIILLIFIQIFFLR